MESPSEEGAKSTWAANVVEDRLLGCKLSQQRAKLGPKRAVVDSSRSGETRSLRISSSVKRKTYRLGLCLLANGFISDFSVCFSGS